ncbi:MAG TPA: PDZ domain-containing protein, partial [Myxococcales bacterium]|nr:PDZ domain-containing protein [Myxococcales bacterium]
MTVGRVRRGFLGLAGQVRPLPKRLARRLDLAVDTGVQVMQVEPGKPAARGGLLPGDVIVALDGKPVRDVDEVHRLLDGNSIGRKLAIKAVRGNDLVDLEVTPAEG